MSTVAAGVALAKTPSGGAAVATDADPPIATPPVTPPATRGRDRTTCDGATIAARHRATPPVPIVPAPVSNVPERPPENETSFQLLNRARGGDADAREALCALYLPRLHRWAKGRMPPAARGPLDTGDIVQEVLMQVIAKLEIFEPQELWSFQAYLRRTLQHRLCDLARRVKRTPAAGSLDTSSPSADVSPFEAAVKAEDRARYQAALKRLRREDQRAVVARCEWDMSYAEVAELLGKSTANAARVAIHRALVRLAKDMAHARRQTTR